MIGGGKPNVEIGIAIPLLQTRKIIIKELSEVNFWYIQGTYARE